MKLYYSPGACSLASHIVAEELGLALDYEAVDLKTHRTAGGADFTAINPKGYVPALLLDDGALLTENVALLPYLGELKPQAGLVPPCGTPARARLNEWLGYITGEIHKSFAPLFHGEDEAHKGKARETLSKRFAFADAALTGDFLLGESFCVADAYLFVMLTWTDKTGVDVSPFRHLAAFRARVAQRPAVKRAMAMEGLR